MDSYIVSARKYRPSTFRSVVGQKALTQTLKNAIDSHKLAHAYLFCGPRGVGKTSCARIFAKTINCLHPTPEGEACNECESCRAFNEQRSFNISELDAASNNSVEDIRQLTDQVRIPPQIGQYKVFIIDEVHMLSQAAFNAFLKTLEEPPHHAIFILATTEKHKILPTILSRCQIYDFQRIGVADIVEQLQYIASQEGISAEDNALNVIAQKADGGMRDALSIFDQVTSFTGGNITYQAVINNLNVLDYEYYFRLTEAFLSHSVSDALLLFDQVLNKGFDAQHFISGMGSHLRDLLVCKDPVTLPLLEASASVRERYAQQAAQCQLPFLYKAMELSNECDLNYRVSKNKRLLIELTLIRICQLGQQPQTGNAVQAPLLQAVSNPGTPQPTPAVAPATPKTTPAPPAMSGPSPASPTTTQTPPPQFKVPEVPAAKTPPTKTATAIPSISIKNPKVQKEEPTNRDKMQSVPEMNTPFDEKMLTEAWLKFTQTIPTEALLIKTMQLCLPHLLDSQTFEVAVENPDQIERLNQKAPDLLLFLKQQLKNSHIRMQIRQSAREERKRVFSQLEKFEYMVKKNPKLADLTKTFGLELS